MTFLDFLHVYACTLPYLLNCFQGVAQDLLQYQPVVKDCNIISLINHFN